MRERKLVCYLTFMGLGGRDGICLYPSHLAGEGLWILDGRGLPPVLHPRNLPGSSYPDLLEDEG